jgi:hypothetical protein
MIVYRVQDKKGRGPFRPGVPKKWADKEFSHGCKPMPTWMEEFGIDLIDRFMQPGEFYGCAVKEREKLNEWFSEDEALRLHHLGYFVYAVEAKRIIAESPNQIVFACDAPIKKRSLMIGWPLRARLARNPLPAAPELEKEEEK